MEGSSHLYATTRVSERTPIRYERSRTDGMRRRSGERCAGTKEGGDG